MWRGGGGGEPQTGVEGVGGNGCLHGRAGSGIQAGEAPMRSMMRRVKRLQRAMGVSDVLEPTMVITNVFIDSDGTVVDTLVLKIPSHAERQRALAGARGVQSRSVGVRP